MEKQTCVVDGVKYVSSPELDSDIMDMCKGCAFESDGRACDDAPNCWTDDYKEFIWIKEGETC